MQDEDEEDLHDGLQSSTCLHLSHLLVSDGVEAGRLDLVAVVMETHVTQHHDGAEQQGGGVRHVQAGDVRGGAMNLHEGHTEINNQSDQLMIN